MEAEVSGNTACDVEVVELSESESCALFEQVVQREMGIGREEFLRRWDDGEWQDVNIDEVPGLAEVWAYLPFAR